MLKSRLTASWSPIGAPLPACYWTWNRVYELQPPGTPRGGPNRRGSGLPAVRGLAGQTCCAAWGVGPLTWSVRLLGQPARLGEEVLEVGGCELDAAVGAVVAGVCPQPLPFCIAQSPCPDRPLPSSPSPSTAITATSKMRPTQRAPRASIGGSPAPGNVRGQHSRGFSPS